MSHLDDLDLYLTALGDGSPVMEQEQAELDSFKACYDRYNDAGVDFTQEIKPKALAGVDLMQYLTPESWQDLRVGPVWNDQAFDEYFSSNDISDEEKQAALREALEPDYETIRATAKLLSEAAVTIVEFPRTNIPPLDSTLDCPL
jgi:hypothetical protein